MGTILQRKSLFLFGPRQTGKSTWIQSTYPEGLYINLLKQRVFDHYSNRFLGAAALTSAQQVNFTQIGNDAQTPARTIHDYFQILEDTLIGFMLPAFIRTKRRKAMTSAKFYLFDTGVTNALMHRSSLTVGTPESGAIFEQYIVSEVRAYQSYESKRADLFYWRSLSKSEVDLVIETADKLLAVEIKCKPHMSESDYGGLRAFREDQPEARVIVVSLVGHRHLTTDGIEVIPAFEFLKALWSGEFF